MIKWPYPGMRVKRWLFIALTGLTLVALGIDLLTGGRLLGEFARSVHRLEGRFLQDGYDWVAGVLIIAEYRSGTAQATCPLPSRGR